MKWRFPTFVCAALFAFLFGLFISTFLIENNTYATTVDCSNSYSISYGQTYSFSSCDTSSLDSSKTWYYHGDITLTNLSSSRPYGRLIYDPSPNSYAPYGNYFFYNMDSNNRPNSFSFITYDWVGSYTDANHFNRFELVNSSLGSIHLYISDIVLFENSSTGSLTITENGTYDVSSYSEAVVNVPVEVNSDTVSAINGVQQAVITGVATLLVLYFFYCIYRLIIRNSGVK